ncbi:hypothetical protein HK405_012272, partial [Cladochytrium tenue]
GGLVQLLRRLRQVGRRVPDAAAPADRGRDGQPPHGARPLHRGLQQAAAVLRQLQPGRELHQRGHQEQEGVREDRL